MGSAEPLHLEGKPDEQLVITIQCKGKWVKKKYICKTVVMFQGKEYGPDEKIPVPPASTVLFHLPKGEFINKKIRCVPSHYLFSKGRFGKKVEETSQRENDDTFIFTQTAPVPGAERNLYLAIRGKPNGKVIETEILRLTMKGETPKNANEEIPQNANEEIPKN